MLNSPIEVSVIMPCLNEAETLGRCIEKACAGFRKTGVIGEVVVADNGSTDGSIEIAEALGARVQKVSAKGYGHALRGGIEAASGRFIIMGDADDSYDFSEIGAFLGKLRDGFDLVMGCRLPSGGGTIAREAMPWKNRWVGNPVLSTIGRVLFRTQVRDFHCGMRAFTREAFLKMDMRTAGMEFASEMVMKASIQGLRVTEVPITLHKDGRTRPPHLRPWRDGWRHLRFMLVYSPRWLFLVPGLLLLALGSLGGVMTLLGPCRIGPVTLDVGTMMLCSMGVILGLQLVSQAFYAKVFAMREGLLPDDPDFNRLFNFWTLEKGCLIGLVSSAVGCGVLLWSVLVWKRAAFGPLDYAENLRRLITGATLLVLGIQTIFASFHLSVLGLKVTNGARP
ncbi:MAG: dolichol-P-glucose synthetase [Gemmatimonas sp.]|nr:dolichol-P-glucose synthetase [Gemmatimonas sp.]